MSEVEATSVASSPDAALADARRRRLFVGVLAVASAFGMAKGIIFAKILGADQLGYYGIVLIVTTLGVTVAGGGVHGALNGRLPIAYGRRDADVPELVDQALGALTLSAAATALVYLALVAGLRPSDPDRTLALVLAAGLTVAATWNEFFILLLRVERQLPALSGMYLARASLAIVVGAVTGTVWGWEGVVASEFVALVVTSLISRRVWLATVRPRRPSLDRMRWLWRWGIPVTFTNLIFVATFAADRVFVAGALPGQLGQYTFASFVVTAALAVSGMLSQIFGPQLLFELGAGMSLAELRGRVLRIEATVAAVGVVGLVVTVLLARALGHGAFAEYGPGLRIVPMLYAGGLLYVLAFPGYLVQALTPALSTVAVSVGAGVVTVGGVILTATAPTLGGYAWLFVGGQVASAAVLLFVFVRITTGHIPCRELTPRVHARH